MLRILLGISFFIFCSFFAFSQPDQLSNQRKRLIVVADLPKNLDSLTIIPSSMVVIDASNGKKIDSTFYKIERNILSWNGNESEKPNSINVFYKVLPYDLYRSFYHLDTTKIEIADDGNYIGFNVNPYDQQEGLIDFKGLDYNGSFARGISFGNNQSLVLNSSFNLQLSGNLGDDIELLAAISDNNIPLQPEGNTQLLQEFDKIFIQIKRRENVLTAGDYELGNPNGYFMRYFKKLQGATFSNQTDIFKKGKISSRASIGVARGKFARNNILQQEGNQGPYKLQGANGEAFIIVLAGTEKVYIDGQIMKRGIEQDYIIDYNRGDITFTNKRLITKDTRIIVEFEYSDQSYLRSMYGVDTEYQDEKFRLHIGLFSEQDSKTSGGARDLDSLSRAILADVGDNVDEAFALGIDSLEEFNEFRITYKIIDTTYTVMGEDSTVQILVYSTNPDSAFYAANFIDNGFGGGDYIIDNSTAANGRVYRWIAPDPVTGKSQGNYVPGIKLIAPNKKTMYKAGAAYQFSKSSSITAEVAISQNDANRFSSKDDQDDTGIGVFTRFQRDKGFGNPEKGWRLKTELDYEYIQESFKALNPYRNAEFSRDWNIANTLDQDTAVAEQIGRGGLALSKKDLGSIQYQFSGFLRSSIYTGTRHFARTTFRKAGFNVDLQANMLSTRGQIEESSFFRPKIDISKTFSKLNDWKLGVYGEREKNSRSKKGADTLSLNSFYYDMYKVYIESRENEKMSLGVNYTQRFDYAPVSSEFQNSTIAEELNLNGKWVQGRTSNLRWNLTYRQLEIADTTLSTLDPQETFLGRIEHSLTLWKGTVRSSTNYEIGSGQEPKLEYNYLPVQKGEGVYTWVADLNGDGIPQVNEIEEAAFQSDADIIRVAIVTNDFIRTNNVLLNQSLRIDPRLIWHQKTGFKKFISKFSNQSTFRIVRKSKDADGVSPWNPFQQNIADSALVSLASSIRSTLFFNRANPVYDLQASIFDNRNNVVLTSGFESRRFSEQMLRSRINIGQKLSSILSISKGINANDSEFFDNRDYQIEYLKIEPKITYQPFKNFRTILTYNFKNSKNTLPEGGESAVNHNFSLETTFNKTTKSSLRLNLSFVKISFDGEKNSSLEFIMLEGLQDGNNYLWNLVFDRRLAKNIQLSISYEGRKTGDANTVHVGRAQVRATF